jgi:hypothetical protein
MYGIRENLYLIEWGELPYIDYENKILLDSLRKLNQNVEISLTEASGLLKKKIGTDRNYILLSDEKPLQSSYLSQIYDLDIETIKVLRRQQRYALTLIVFSFFESRLVNISKYLEKITSVIVPKKAAYGKKTKQPNDWEVWWLYIEKNHEIDLTEIQELFDFINKQKFVRDKIAHKNGFYHRNDEKSEYYKFIKTPHSDASSIGEDFRIEILNGQYVDSMLLMIEELLKKLIIAIDIKFKK